MLEYVACIDLGSNTFQLLLAQKTDNQYLIVLENSFSVKLFYDQNEKNTLSDTAITRAKNETKNMIEILANYPLHTLKVVATSAFRDLINGEKLANFIHNELKSLQPSFFHFKIITGNIEARLVGLAQKYFLMAKLHTHCLIIDIGGGSVEFAYVSANGNLHTQSLKIGVARLVQDFNIIFEQPLLQYSSLLDSLYVFINHQLVGLQSFFNSAQNVQILGVGGAFETNAILLGKKNKEDKYAVISISEFETLFETLMQSTAIERANNPLIPEIRKDMILIANIIIYSIIQKYKVAIENIVYSGYDLKYALLCNND